MNKNSWNSNFWILNLYSYHCSQNWKGFSDYHCISDRNIFILYSGICNLQIKYKYFMMGKSTHVPAKEKEKRCWLGKHIKKYSSLPHDAKIYIIFYFFYIFYFSIYRCLLSNNIVDYLRNLWNFLSIFYRFKLLSSFCLSIVQNFF